ncbi:hypothetical protein L873DRAFT_1787545 [Choiromyces venosus 120613-1]|uniref:Uncharacterized protein n=1 Tax=Choiromyces venosus 120613-1 TaxID=1336337 RepID=A0A3N4JVZ5_9PEZI|nr:hypothetical protein L873DRAFT_1787545 [Choiromyces venosus 120613-1]
MASVAKKPDTQNSPITDLSIVARWDPRNAAEVFLYTKIIPQPGEKLALLHLPAPVTKKTLIRAIPLLPDGSSPRSSPGILALGIPVVSGRRREKTLTPVNTRRASGITLDGGACIGEEEAVQVQIPVPGSVGIKKSKTGDGVKSGYRGESGGGKLVICGGRVKTGSIDERVPLPGTHGEVLPPPLSVADQVVLPGGRELAYEHTFTAYSPDDSMDLHGDEGTLGWSTCRKRRGRTKAYPKGKLDCDGSVASSIGSESRDDTAIIKRKEPDKLSVGGVSEKLDGMVDTNRFAPLDSSYHSPGQNNDQVIPVEGEIGRIIPDQEECLGIRMTTDGDKLSVAFPEKVGGCAFVIEIMLNVEPLYLDGKPYGTFVFADLPRCKNPAYIDFRIRDSSVWKFDSNPTLDSCSDDGPKVTGSRLCGTLDTSKFNQNAPKNLLIRVLRCPDALEVLNFEMQIETKASFSWCPDEQIIAKFDIKLEFPGIVLDTGPKRYQIYLFVTNGPDRLDDLTVESPGSDIVEYSLGEHEFLQTGFERMVKILQVERFTKDMGNPLRVCFLKKQGIAPQTIDIPKIRARDESKITGETILIQTPKLPLFVDCSPDKLHWREVEIERTAENVPDLGFMRLRPGTGEEFLCVLISALAPAQPIAIQEFYREQSGYHNFVDQVAYSIEESTNVDTGFPSIGVSMRFSLVVPLSVEPMDEIIRIHSGGFRLKFATINHIFVGKGVVFEDKREIVLLNYELIGQEDDSNLIFKPEERLLIHIEWSSETHQILPHGKVEYRLPQMSGKVIGRAIVKCSSPEARVIYRAQGPSEILNVSTRFTRGRTILTGLDNKSRELFFEIPYSFSSGRGSLTEFQASEQGRTVLLIPNAQKPGSRQQTLPSPSTETTSSNDDLISDPEMSITLANPGLQSPMPAGEERVVYIAGCSDRRWSGRWFFAFFLALILAANFLDQTSKVDELKVWLRRTEAMLKEVEHSHQQLLEKSGHEGERFYMSLIGSLGLNDLLAVAPAPVAGLGWENTFAPEIYEQGRDETETEEEEKLLQEAYPVKAPQEGTERSLAHHKGVARVLQEVPLSKTIERVMVSTMDYLWGLVLRACRRHGNNGAAE